MTEILHSLFNPLSNAIMSGFMIVILIYWLFSFLGIGLGEMDFDTNFGADIDSDIDVDAQVDTDTQVDTDHHGEPSPHAEVDDSHVTHENAGDSLFIRFLKFMNVGKVPFMLVLSTLKFFTWAGALVTTQLTIAGSWGWKSVFILIPCFIAGVILTRYATKPLARFLSRTGYQGEERTEFLGRSGRMMSTITKDKIGSAEFIIEKNPIRLNVISHNGDEIKYGESVMITDETQDKKFYYVTKEVTIDQN
ncbi:DUF1449 family protein [Apibacter raozihei]|uniref:OB-fold-containig protein n=1 Tax=Apibacter raozihei TaxID=2500547 RepID=UPI000FE38FAF|nr:OB-fold-containig protein [Apibacter raozihei]